MDIDNRRKKNFYSFASKYCSRYNPLVYPNYDSYVDMVLRYFRRRDAVSEFSDKDLRMEKTMMKKMKSDVGKA